jgi:lipid-A-disaccharide synthase
MGRASVVMICGEPSGDRLLATVARALDPRLFSSLFGVCGEAMEGAGVEAVADVRALGAMGLGEGVSGVATILRSVAQLVREIEGRRPEVAILASWSTPNAWLGRWLRGRGVKVVWIAPPEIWAWGRFRGARLARAADRFVVTLPFEEQLWRGLGVDAKWFGHPTLALARPTRRAARDRLALDDDALAIAILAGSRASEIERLAAPMIEAALRFAATRPRVQPIVVVAPSMGERARAELRDLARKHGVSCVDAGATSGALDVLPAFDAALVASGTASLECAIAEVPAVVAYALHPLTHRLAQALVTTPAIALPNVLQRHRGGAPIYPERVQRDVNAAQLARDLDDVVARAPEIRAACATLRGTLGGEDFAEAVAAWIGEEGWRAGVASSSPPR